MTPKTGVDAKLDEILEIVRTIEKSAAVLGSRVDVIETTTKNSHEAIKGNGKAGLESRTMLLERQVAVINWIGGIIVIAIIGDIIARVLSLI